MSLVRCPQMVEDDRYRQVDGTAMDGMDVIKWAADVLLPVLTGVTGWLAGRRKRNNDFLNDLQDSINTLSAKNAELVKTVVTLNETVISLRAENAELKSEVTALRGENKQLSDEIAQLREQLGNIRSVTRKTTVR